MTDTTDGIVPALPGGGDGAGITGAGSGRTRTRTRGGSGGADQERWAAIRVSALAAGAVAAGLGLGAPVAVVLLLWIGSPFPDGGLGGALHLGAGLWLLAQGAELVRTETLSGDPAPVALTPLLLSALPAWLLYRGTASAVTAEETRDVREAARVAGWVLAGYVSAAAMVVAYTAAGPFHVRPVTALYVPVFAAVAAGCGAWSGCGRPMGRLRGYAAEVRAALRAAAIAAGILLGGGALLGAAALAWHAGASGQTYAQLSASITGRFSVLLTAIALVPNLAVWGASYALGAGFAVGAGAAVAPAGVSARPVLPGFPLLAAVPGPGGGGVGWAALVVPAVAAGAVARCAVREGWDGRRTARVAAGAALLYGTGVAVLAAWSGGPLGTGLLSDFGPSWWRAGALACGWTLAVGLPGAHVLRTRGRPPAPPWRTFVRSLRPAARPGPLAQATQEDPANPAARPAKPSHSDRPPHPAQSSHPDRPAHPDRPPPPAPPAPPAPTAGTTPPDGPLAAGPHPRDPLAPPKDDDVLLPPPHEPLPWPPPPPSPPSQPPPPPAPPEHPGPL